MYLMYVDESGDSGLTRSPTRYFILTAIVFHELRWKQILNDHIAFRRALRQSKGLKLREEIHASHFINNPGNLSRIPRNDRLDILKQTILWINAQPDLNVFSVAIDKQGRSTDVFEFAWLTLIQRFENTISHKNFKGPQNPDDRGLILADNTDGTKLQQLVRKMRHYNAIPNTGGSGYRIMPLQYVIEDPIMRDSSLSYLHQMCDVVAYFARQKYEPNAYIRKKGARNFYDRLQNVICKKVTTSNQLGIVEY